MQRWCTHRLLCDRCVVREACAPSLEIDVRDHLVGVLFEAINCKQEQRGQGGWRAVGERLACVEAGVDAEVGGGGGAGGDVL